MAVAYIGLAVDPLAVVRALRVAVAGAVLGASSVGRVLGLAAVGVHLHKVQRAVQPARQLGHVDVDGELLVLQLEELVVLLVLHQEGARADVGRVLTGGDEGERERVAIRVDAVRRRVLLVRALDHAVGRAGRRIGAEGRVPQVARVAIVGRAGLVQPAPVGVDRHRLGLRRAPTRHGAR
jgi:hypothetical protein